MIYDTDEGILKRKMLKRQKNWRNKSRRYEEKYKNIKYPRGK